MSKPVSNDEETLQVIVTRITEAINPQSIILFGSWARGEGGPHSDIDLLIIGNPNKQSLIDQIASLENRLQREINYQTYSRQMFSRKKLEKNSFIMETLKGPKTFLLGDEHDL